jgi:hypothetical protein
LVRVAAGLLVAVLVLCGCWGEAPPSPPPAPTTRPQRVQTTRPPPERTPGRLPGVEVVGLCMMQSRAGEREFLPCNRAPRPGFRLRGKVIDAIPEPPDAFVGTTSTTVRSLCPSGTGVVRTLLPSGNVGVLCVDTVPSYGNTRS